MSLFSLTWGVAQGIGPVAGASWLGGGVAGVLTVMAFVVLALRARHREKQV